MRCASGGGGDVFVVDVVVVEGKMGWDDSSLAVTMCQLLRQVQDDLRYFPMVRKA